MGETHRLFRHVGLCIQALAGHWLGSSFLCTCLCQVKSKELGSSSFIDRSFTKGRKTLEDWVLRFCMVIIVFVCTPDFQNLVCCPLVYSTSTLEKGLFFVLVSGDQNLAFQGLRSHPSLRSARTEYRVLPAHRTCETYHLCHTNLDHPQHAPGLAHLKVRGCVLWWFRHSLFTLAPRRQGFWLYDSLLWWDEWSLHGTLMIKGAFPIRWIWKYPLFPPGAT